MSDTNFMVAVYRIDGKVKVLSGPREILEKEYGAGTCAWFHDGYEWQESEKLRMKLEGLGQEGLKAFVNAPTKTIDLKGGEDGNRRSSDPGKS